MLKLTGFGVALASVVAAADHTLEDFNTKLFWKRPEQGYYEVDVGLPDSPAGMRIMAIADLNNDKLNDLVTVDATAQTVTVFYYDDTVNKYSKESSFDLEKGWTVDSIIPTAIVSGLQDLIVVASKASSGSLQTKMVYYKQRQAGGENIISQYTWELESNELSETALYPGSQPMTLDVNGDQAMDLLYQSPGNGGIMVSLGSRAQPTKWKQQDFFSNYVLSSADNKNCKDANTSDLISMPNSNSFLDLNGDCVPEIVLTRQSSASDKKTYYEIYSQLFVNGESKYCLAAQDGQLVDPADVRSGTSEAAKMPFIEFADFNRDGMTDMAFASETGVLTILYNQYSAPGPKSTNLCSDVGNTSDLKNRKMFPTFPFSASDNGVTQVKLADQSKKTVSFEGLAPSMPSYSEEPAVPGRLRVTDVDMDGYPDVVMTLAFKNTTADFTKTAVLLNQAGEDGERKLKQVKPGDGTYLSNVLAQAGENAAFLTFIDMDDDGKLDFIVQKESKDDPQIKILYNNIVSDNFFIKALSVNSELKKSNNVYNDYSIGSSYRFVITDMEDTKLVTVGSQRFQSGYMSLQMPFTSLGVGRSNNYVETFYAATAIDGKRVEKMWTPIIPNSQLIIFMYGTEAANWGLELFISPTNSLYLIVMVCAICLVAIGLAIIWLHVKEKQEDAKKREQHFDFF